MKSFKDFVLASLAVAMGIMIYNIVVQMIYVISLILVRSGVGI